MDNYFDINLYRLATAYIFVIILILIVKYQKVGHQYQILLASIRMTVQLGIVGYVLTYIFNNPNIFLTLIILIVMEIFAVYNIFERIDNKINKKLKKIIAIAMFVGTGLTIVYFISVIINLKPWFNARYIIPISGMLIGNSMTGITLGSTGLINGINDNKELIENALILGADPAKASKEISKRAFYDAILPTLNSMLGMGIVFLPGMMTGQILAGLPALQAIKYQIAIMMGIMGSVTLTVFILIKWGIKTFFNKRLQLIIDDEG